MSNPTSVVVPGDDLAQFLARTNQFGESNQTLVQQKFNKKQADGSTNPVFAALESRSRAIAQWANLVDDFMLASFDAAAAQTLRSGVGSPEGSETAPVGTLYIDTGVVAGNGPTLYSKETGTGNTGWVAMAPERAGSTVYGRGQLGAHVVVGTETLTADTSYQSLTVPVGTVLETNGFRVNASQFIQIDVGGIVRNNGGDASGPTAGAASAGGSVGSGTTGGAGGNFGAGGVGGTPVTDTSGGASGGAGGAGDGGAGGNQGFVDPPNANQGDIEIGLPHLAAVVGFGSAGPGTIIVLAGGTGGGGGAGDGAARPGGGGGGGAGLVVLCAPVLANNGLIEVVGGDGDDGNGSGNTGGGGGGGGGLIITVARFRSGIGTVDVSGGAAGAPGGTGVAGTAGGIGSNLEFNS